MKPYRLLHNIASFHTHHPTEAVAQADFAACIEAGLLNGWTDFDLKCVRNLLTIHYGPGTQRIVFDESPPTPQELRELNATS